MAVKDILNTIFNVTSDGKTPKRLSTFIDDSSDDSSSSKFAWMANSIKLDYERRSRYRDYENMDEGSIIIQSALDIYAQEASPYDERRGATVWITSSDKKVKEILNELFDRIELEDKIFSIFRDLAKYGEVGRFLPQVKAKKSVSDGETVRPNSKIEAVTSQEFVGVYALEEVPFLEVEPLFDKGRLVKFIIGQDERKPWEFFYTKLRTHSRTLFAGDQAISHPMAMIEPIRKHWKMLRILETALSVHRISRAPGQRTFYIDTTGLTPQQAQQLTESYRRRYKRNVYVNQAEGQMEITLNLSAMTEDMFWPTTKDNNSRIEVNNSGFDVRAIEDVKYFREQVIMGTGIPPEYLGLSASGGSLFDRNLTQKDVKFSNKVRPLQRAVLQGLYTLCQIELALNNIDIEEVEFDVHMSKISYLAEMQKVTVLTEAVNMVKKLQELGQLFGIQNDQKWLTFMMSVTKSFIGDAIGLDEISGLDKMIKPASAVDVPIDGSKADVEPKKDDTAISNVSGASESTVTESMTELAEVYGYALAEEISSILGPFTESNSVSRYKSSKITTVIPDDWKHEALLFPDRPKEDTDTDEEA